MKNESSRYFNHIHSGYQKKLFSSKLDDTAVNSEKYTNIIHNSQRASSPPTKKILISNFETAQLAQLVHAFRTQSGIFIARNMFRGLFGSHVEEVSINKTGENEQNNNRRWRWCVRNVTRLKCHWKSAYFWIVLHKTISSLAIKFSLGRAFSDDTS